MNFEINTYGIQTLSSKIKDFYLMLIQGFFIYIFFLWVFKYTVKSEVYFLFLVIFISLLYVFASIIIPITLRIRINKVVRKIQCDDNKVSFVSNKENVFDRSEVSFIEVKNRFSGFSREKKDGILIKTKGGKEFWIIEDFYNDYEKLKALLMGIVSDTE